VPGVGLIIFDWRLPIEALEIRSGALTPRDVKNEATSGDVHENTGQ
jgi:hypothetical protein